MNTKELSQEEKWMMSYLDELQLRGFIKYYTHQPDPFILSDQIEYKFRKEFKTKDDQIINKTLINGHIYTPDFFIQWNELLNTKLVTHTHKIFNDGIATKLPPFLCNMDGKSYVEVKGIFDRNNMTRLFTTRTQPWVFEKFRIYINLIKMPDLLKNTFIPESILSEFFYKRDTKKNKVGDKKYQWKYKSLKEFITS